MRYLWPIAVCACRYTPVTAASDAAPFGGEPVIVVDAVDAQDGTIADVECPSSPDLVACWGFEGDGTDGSGNGHTAMLVATSFVAGMHGSAVDRTSGSDITITASTDFDITTYTLELWVQADAAPPATQRVVLYDQDNQYGIVWQDTLAIECSFAQVPTGAVRAAGGMLTVGPWTHIACNYDGTALRTFIDGSEVANTPSTGTVRTGTATPRLGEDHPTGNDTLDGRFDSVRLWRVARAPML